MPRRARRCGGSPVMSSTAVADGAFARLEEAGDDGEQRGLAGAVWADQPGDAADRRRQRRSVHCEQAAEAVRHAIDRPAAAQPWPASRAENGRRGTVDHPLACIGDGADDTARRERNDQHQRAAIGDQIETGCVASDQLGAFAERLDNERAEQRPEHGADPADDRRQQRLDRDPGAVSDAGVDEEKVLRVETAGCTGDGGRQAPWRRA